MHNGLHTPSVAHLTIPGAMALACTMIWAGRLADKFDRRLLALGGLSAFALASYWFSFLALEQPVSWVTGMIAARYLSVGFVFTPINTASLMLLHSAQIPRLSLTSSSAADNREASSRDLRRT